MHVRKWCSRRTIYANCRPPTARKMKKYSNNVSESEPTDRTPKLIGENWRDSSIYSTTPPSQQPGDPNEWARSYLCRRKSIEFRNQISPTSKKWTAITSLTNITCRTSDLTLMHKTQFIVTRDTRFRIQKLRGVCRELLRTQSASSGRKRRRQESGMRGNRWGSGLEDGEK